VPAAEKEVYSIGLGFNLLATFEKSLSGKFKKFVIAPEVGYIEGLSVTTIHSWLLPMKTLPNGSVHKLCDFPELVGPVRDCLV